MRAELATFTNMCMVYQGDKVLVQDRQDPNWSGLTFPGGHVERGESFVESVIREIREETGLKIQQPKLCGIKQFTTEGTGRYVVLLFKTDSFSGEIRSSEEGEVFWMTEEALLKEKLTPGFEDLLKIFNGEATESFHFEEADAWQQILKL